MNDDKYIHNAYLNILKDNNIKYYNYSDVYLSFKDDIFIKLLSQYSEKINNRLNHLTDIDTDEKYLYSFNDLIYLNNNISVSYCIFLNKYIKNINNKISICQKCSLRTSCCIINIDINDMNKYFNVYLDKNIILR